MRTGILVAVALIAGIVTGAAVSISEFYGVEEITTIEGVSGKKLAQPEVIVVNGIEHNFGQMQAHTSKEHTFILKNTGTKPLTLNQLDTSCMCTMSHITTERLMPGETTTVILTWKPEAANNEFSQHAEIGTNDPRSPLLRLRIRGQVRQSVSIQPRTVDLQSFTSRESRTVKFEVLGYMPEETLKVSKIELLPADEEKFIEFTTAPIPAGMASDPSAKSGVLVTVQVKPGLPLGRIQRTIRLHVNTGEGDTVEAELIGAVVSDISWLGTSHGFRRGSDLLTIGSVPHGAGKDVRMHLVVKGPHRKDVKLEVSKVEPAASLRATIGKAIELNGGKSVMHPITITIPKDAASVSRLGLTEERRGVLVIKTTHPKVKQMKLFVNFAVEPE